MNNRRNLLVNNKSGDEFVDLGLPSGLKWAKGNLKKSGSSWIVGNETDYGDFWSWGNVGDSSDTGYAQSEGDTLSYNMYNLTTGSQLTGNIPVDAAYDVARNRLGYPWRLPTNAECEELLDNTDFTRTTINGIYGYKFMKKTDHSIYVFFPASGSCDDNGLKERNSRCYCWSSTVSSLSPRAYCLYTSDSEATTKQWFRYCGFSVRPVSD